MDICVDVIGQKLRIATNEKRFASGTNQFIRFIFHITDDWKKLAKTVVFEQGDSTYPSSLDENNAVFLPSEIKSGVFFMTLYGAGTNISAKTFPVKLIMDNEFYTSSGNNNSQIVVNYDIATLDETKMYIGI